MADIIFTIVLIVAIATLFGVPGLYYGGLLVSRGYHRGKREFINELTSEAKMADDVPIESAQDERSK